ncbi:MAG TPA: Ig-like domain-containing protein [Acidimicrobiia bacterium]|nr:Ig-like domain-containing protein [Acidimicrobiia bacterium]
MWKRLALAVCALMLATGMPLLWPVGPATGLTGSFAFGAAGDLGATADTSAVLNAVAGAGLDFFMAEGDLSYSDLTPESAWCNFVTSRVGATFPFELVSGNHEDNGPDGNIANFAACLPDRIGGLTGSYTKEYYFDYPASAPLARMINISPNLAFAGETTYNYTVGSAHYTWLANAIDSARAAGIPWVVVSMHENCIKAGSTSCEIGTALQNLLVSKKVDLVLQGHTHTYQRSKQLALGSACPSVTNTAYDADCVVNTGATGSYAKGAGMVLVITGVGGKAHGSVTTSDPDSQYFAKLNGSGSPSPSSGFTKFTVTPTALSAQFVNAVGTFTDSFTIGTPSGDQPPTAAGASLATPQDTPLPVTLTATDPDDCAVTFSVTAPPAHGTLDPLPAPNCTPGTPNQITVATAYHPDAGFNGIDTFSFRANDGELNSNTGTVSVTVGTPPPPPPGVTFRAASSAKNATATTLTINRPARAVAGDVWVAGVGTRTAPTVTPPAGWTLIRRDQAGTYTTQALYYHVVTAAEPASYTWKFSASVPAAGGISDYQGVNTTTPVNNSAGAGQNINSLSIVAPSVMTTVAAAQVVGFFSIGGGNTISPPPGMTERGEASSTAGSNHVTWETSDFALAAAGATGSRTATASSSPHPSVGALVALTPGVAPPNQAPVASDISVTTPQDTAIQVTLPASDADNCELSFVVNQPAHGTVTAGPAQACVPGSPNHDSTKATYTPAAGYTGPDSFTFKANDGTADSNAATVSVTVTAPPPPTNQPPVAQGATVTTAQNTAVTTTLQATDPDNCGLNFTVVTPPAHGTLTPSSDPACAAGSPNHDSVVLTYTPAAGYSGPDSFTFKANDGTVDSNVATVSLTIGSPPPPPAAITFRSASSAQNPTGATLSIPKPAGVVPGDVLVAAVGIRGAPAVNAPAGWTLVRRDQAGTYTTQAIYYRVVTAVEPNSYLWSFSAPVPAAGGILAYQGVKTSAPVNASNGGGLNSDSLSITAPSVTTTVAGARVLGFFSIGGGNTITPPTGMTERGEASSTAGSNHVTWEGSDLAQVAPGATGPQTAAASPKPHPNVGALVALNPA